MAGQLIECAADFVYARLQRCRESEPTGYGPAEIESWADRAKAWSSGGMPSDLAPIGDKPEAGPARDVFAFFITDGKVNAPFGAKALQQRLG